MVWETSCAHPDVSEALGFAKCKQILQSFKKLCSCAQSTQELAKTIALPFRLVDRSTQPTTAMSKAKKRVTTQRLESV